MNDAFSAGLAGSTGVQVRIGYKDSGTGALAVTAFGKDFSVQKQNSGLWKSAEFPTNVSSNTPRIQIKAVDGDLVLHMFEVLRGKSGSVGTKTFSVPAHGVSLAPAFLTGKTYDFAGRRITGLACPASMRIFAVPVLHVDTQGHRVIRIAQ